MNEETEHKILAKNMGYLGVYGILLNRILKKKKDKIYIHVAHDEGKRRDAEDMTINFRRKAGKISRLNNRPSVSEGGHAFM